jgi:RHS repeat-associated protein
LVHEVQLAYNEFGQVVTSWQAHGGSVNTSTTPKVQYQYADGSAGTIRPTLLVYPDGREIGYDYGSSNGADDAASRVRDMEDQGVRLVRYGYLGLGTPVEVGYRFLPIDLPGGGGYTREMKYTLVGTSFSNDPDMGDQYKGLDRFGRVKDSRWVRYHNGTPGDLDRIKYGYDRASNRVWRENPVAASLSKEFDELYAHDGLHRLKQSARGTLDSGHSTLNSTTFAQCWTLDATGNWKGFRQDDHGDGTWDLAQQRTANGVNEITGVTDTAGPSWATPGYDAAGNMTTVPQPADPTTSYTATYDAWNRLVKLKDGSDTVQENAYDARRYRTVRKDYASGVVDETRHIYYTEQWQSIEERVGTSSDPERRHVWGLRYIDDLVLRERDTDGNGMLDESLYALQDANWNVTSVANGLYDVEERYVYTAYGEPAVLDDGFGARSGSSHAWDVLYAGYRWDRAGLYAVRNRVLHAGLGCWNRRDPAADVGVFDMYFYVNCNPVTSIDPFGLESWIDPRSFPDCSPGLRATLDERDRETGRRMTETIEAVGDWLERHPRTMGAVKTIGGVAETLLGAAAIAAPGANLATGAVGAVAAGHGIDTTIAGARQVWTGKPTATLTQQGIENVSLAAGADPSTAATIGAFGDAGIGIGASFGAGWVSSAARGTAIAGGRSGMVDFYGPGDVPNGFSVVRGGTQPMPPAGQPFSGAYGPTLETAATGVPHGTIRSTTAGAIRDAGGTVKVAPEPLRSGQMNPIHADVVEGSCPSVFGPPIKNPVPPVPKGETWIPWGKYRPRS